MNNNSLKINRNKDGTFTVEWDKQLSRGLGDVYKRQDY